MFIDAMTDSAASILGSEMRARMVRERRATTHERSEGGWERSRLGDLSDMGILRQQSRMQASFSRRP